MHPWLLHWNLILQHCYSIRGWWAVRHYILSHYIRVAAFPWRKDGDILKSDLRHRCRGMIGFSESRSCLILDIICCHLFTHKNPPIVCVRQLTCYTLIEDESLLCIRQGHWGGGRKNSNESFFFLLPFSLSFHCHSSFLLGSA